VNLVSTLGTTTIGRLGFLPALGLRDDYAEVVAAHRTGSGEIFGHEFWLALQDGGVV
jgi:hypothetical protein